MLSEVSHTSKFSQLTRSMTNPRYLADVKIIRIIHQQHGRELEWKTLLTVLGPMFVYRILKPLRPAAWLVERRLKSFFRWIAQRSQDSEEDQELYIDYESLHTSGTTPELLFPSSTHSQYSGEKSDGPERGGSPSSRTLEDPDAILPAPLPAALRR